MVLERKVQLERMTWVEVKEAAKESNGIVVIPVGATEQHGPHLPLDTDTAVTVEPVLRAARRVKVVVAPPVPWGNSEQNAYFAGTIAIRPTTMIELMKDIARSLVRHGFDKIVIVNGHGGNVATLSDAAEEIKYGMKVFVAILKGWELDNLTPPPGVPPYDGHGGSKETSLMLYLRPEDVDRSRFIRSEPKVSLTKYGSIWPPQIAPAANPAQIILEAQECFEYGHSGDPSLGTRERGEQVVEAWANTIAEFLSALKEGKITYIKDR